MKKICKRALSLLLCLAMLMAFMPTLTVRAQDGNTEAVPKTYEECDAPVEIVNGDYSFKINKTTFDVGEPILITASGPNSKDWIGVYEWNKSSSRSWKYVDGIGDGVEAQLSTFAGNLPEGEYVIRLQANDSSYFKDSKATVKIKVGNPDTGMRGDPTVLSVDKKVYEAGEPIMVTAKLVNSDSWVGIYQFDQYGARSSQCSAFAWVDNPDKSSSEVNMGDGVAFDITSVLKAGWTLPCGVYYIGYFPNAPTNFETVLASTTILIDGDTAASYDSIAPSEYWDGEGSGTVTPDPDEPTPDDNAIDLDELEQKGITGDTSKLSLEKYTFKKGEPIMVTAYGNGNDWVGIYGSLEQQIATKWHYLSLSGDGVAFDVTRGEALEAGDYYIRFVPNNENLGSTVTLVKVTVTDEIYGEEPDNPDPEEPTPDIPEVSGGITVSNGTHSMSVNKTKFEVGEEILVTANGVNTRDWIGIARRGDREGAIRWYYITDAGNGNPYNIKNAPNIGGNLSDYADIPAGLYTIYLVENDQYLKDAYTFSINISVGDTEDSENGKTDGGTTSGGTPDTSDTTLAPEGVEYTPSGNGYAGGTVTVTMPTQALGNYNIVMYWADANGPLEGYTAHAKTKVYSTVATYTFSESVIVPNGATRLIVYSENRATGELSEEFVSVELPQNSQIGNLGTPNTSFFAISDVHIGSTYGVKHFKLMIKEAITLYPNGAPIFIAGDVTDHGNESEYQLLISSFNEVIDENGADASKYPMFFAIGNHDYPSATGAFLSYATLPDGSHPTDTCYDFWLNGYHYIFLGSDTPSGLNAYFNEDTLEWLDAKLAENRSEDRPSFIILHQSIYNTVSGSLPGEGWHGVTNEDAFKAVISKYPEIVMFNGHSHWEMNSKGNIFEGTEELPIHAFNCASVSYLWTGFNTTQGENLYGSHGYAVDLYDGKIVVRGRDFVNSKWIASAQYSIDFESSCEHEYTESAIEYKNGFGKSGTIAYKCANCSFEKTEECAPLINAKGYSLNSDRTAINGGYTIDLNLLAIYKKLNGELKYGIVIASADAFGGKSFFDADNVVNTDKAIQVEMDAEYSTFNCSINFGTTQNNTLNLVICAYVIDKNGAGFVQADSAASSAVASNKISGGAFKSVTLDSVAALHPEKKDEE